MNIGFMIAGMRVKATVMKTTLEPKLTVGIGPPAAGNVCFLTDLVIEPLSIKFELYFNIMICELGDSAHPGHSGDSAAITVHHNLCFGF